MIDKKIGMDILRTKVEDFMLRADLTDNERKFLTQAAERIQMARTSWDWSVLSQHRRATTEPT